MKVVFLEEVEGTARIGEIKEVKNGFARNFLLPRGLAAPATPDHIRRAEARAQREARRQMALDEDAQTVAAQIEGKTISITARVGEQGKLYGSVTAGDIAEEVAKLLKVDEFDRHKVVLEEPIREVGAHQVPLKLTQNVEAIVEVEIVGEGGLPEPPAAEAEPEPAEAEAAEAGLQPAEGETAEAEQEEPREEQAEE
ncbi:MAG: 50S ribosomal protein L9 [Dehalococcoidia bacterium]